MKIKLKKGKKVLHDFWKYDEIKIKITCQSMPLAKEINK